MANFGPFLAISGHLWPQTWSIMVSFELQAIHFVLWINVALTIFALKLISEAAEAPDGQVMAISGPPVV